ncbi:hypothetical protein A3Q56_03770 [Intoshia linei]|uniref:Tyrosine-protein phosphatase domain-containing protein n=1 Tax=Intoshia linei TaxID=1819745 RepID=A0A177B465_9BILA|nr:hypothetical protein A3Q56_03770 [Intoshia linei]
MFDFITEYFTNLSVVKRFVSAYDRHCISNVKSKPITISQFASVYKNKTRSKYEFYALLQLKNNHSSNFAFLVENIQYNSTLEIIPYDYNRVLIHNHCFINQNDYINAKFAQFSETILVHCCCGAGATAIFIAADQMIDYINSTNLIEVFSCVMRLQNQRMKMINKLEDYMLLYDIVNLYLKCRFSVIDPVRFAAFTSKEAYSTKLENLQSKCLLKYHYMKINSMSPELTIVECSSSFREENIHKSRGYVVFPPERARPYLIIRDIANETDYINAVFVESYIKRIKFIVTQWPLKCTISDFWRLIYDYKINHVILMNETDSKYPIFWPPENTSQHYGKLTISSNNKTHLFTTKNDDVHSLNILCNMSNFVTGMHGKGFLKNNSRVKAFLAELSLRFFSGQQIFLKGFSLHPTYFKTSHFEDLKEFAEKYELFIPCISL